MPYNDNIPEAHDHPVVPLGEDGDKPQRKPMRYVSLHHHSTFSFLDGYQMPDAHVRRASELNMQALALSEHGNVASHVKLEIAAKHRGIKPIYGCELYTGFVEEDTRTQRKNHLGVYAMNSTGYKNMLRMVSRSWRDFYYEPTTGWDNFETNNDGLIVLSGCSGSLLTTSLVGGKNVAPADASYRRGKNIARRFQRLLGDRYYLEIQAFPELEGTIKANKMLAQIGEELGIALVATGDVHYTTAKENEMQQILHNIRGGNRQTLEQQAQAWGYDVPMCPPLTDKAMLKRLVGAGLNRQQAIAAILATEDIASRCTVEIPKMPMLQYPLPSEGCSTRDALWRKWMKEGWHYRKLDRLSPAEQTKYRKRLKYEMRVIEGKEYVDYFLIVSDLVKFAKDSGIPVGPARGSAAASLVCYLLRITEIDPVVYPNLIFERFIDVSRQDLPDIDLDFDSNRRGEIKDYAASKYGPERVGQIGTFTFFKSKNSLDDVARVYRIPAYEVDTVKELLIERSSGDLRASATIEDTLEMFPQAKDVVDRYPELRHSTDLEGNVKGLGVHAAGLVISPTRLDDVTAIYRREVRGVATDVVGLDKYDTERQGLIKIDVLGLSTMSMIAECLRMLNMNLEELYDIPLDDPKVIDSFRKADVVGIFQFDGRAMRNITQELKPDSFKEIADINALARPGPLHNGATAEYIDIKWGRKQPEKFHPLLDRITKDTFYQIVYQEQILRIVREIGDFDWTHAGYIRKIISKKLGEQEFERQFDRFWQGAQTKEGMTPEMARDIWNRCITAGTYAFNAAHSYSYGMLAWWTMWLKVYHPQEFYVASLQSYSEDKQLDLLKDAAKHGIKALPPHPRKSAISWAAEGDNIRGGLIQIKGIGDKSAPLFTAYREQHGVQAWRDYLPIKGVGEKTIASIETFCATEDPYRIHWLERRIEGVRRELVSMGLPMTTHKSAEIPYARGDHDVPVVWLGTIMQRNLRDLYELHYSRTGEVLDPESVKDPELNDWVVMWCSDDDEPVVVTVDRWKYPRFKRGVWGATLGQDLILVKGRKKAVQARRAIYADQLWIITPDEE